MTKIIGTKFLSRTLIKGKTHETHEVELDGLPAVEVEVALTPAIERLKDKHKKAERIVALVHKKAAGQIDDLAAAHAG